MKTMKTILLALAAALAAASAAYAQQAVFDRLSPDLFDVMPPSERVRGAPGTMTIQQTSCRSLPLEEVRRRIVDLAVQEWGFFGFAVVDQTRIETIDQGAPRTRRRWPRPSPEESARVADSIAGYWTVTPDGDWILNNQNGVWNGSRGVRARWRYPWSAAFVSWVMCEGGLGDSSQFQRAVAHHIYIDQAIRARDDGVPLAAFTAYDIGEAPIVPGDLLCSARRPAYRSIAERRRQMGDGARTHCDIVVKVDASRDRILAIGGNVRGSVGLKLMQAVREPDVGLRPEGGRRRLFAHLKLRAEPIEPDALDRSPTMQAVVCADRFRAPAQLAAANVVTSGTSAARC
jgi:hypothetical protein